MLLFIRITHYTGLHTYILQRTAHAFICRHRLFEKLNFHHPVQTLLLIPVSMLGIYIHCLIALPAVHLQQPNMHSMESHLLQITPAAASGNVASTAGRSATITSLIVCCGYVICWSPNEISYLLSFFGYPIDFTGWFYHFTSKHIMTLHFRSCYTAVSRIK